MIIILKPAATEEQRQHIIERIESLGLRPNVSVGVKRTVIGVIGPEDVVRTVPLEAFPGVESVVPILQPFKLVSREFKGEDTVVQVGNVRIGGQKVVVGAGPCAVENREMLLETASFVSKCGASLLRGGGFKPRTSPYSFQGLGEEALKYLAEAREKTGIPVVTELMDPRDISIVLKYADIVQIGMRNMSNFALLKEVGGIDKPVLLKRGNMSTIKEFLMSAEYIVSGGNFNVILCERGIRTFETATRNTQDLSAVPVIKQLSHLPIIVDPSHATGRRNLIEPISKAAIAVGADGLLLEVHPNPETAMSDGPQSLAPPQFAQLMKNLAPVARAVGREL
ncbi:3-deoxy-7-phosphoheptulonate synthase [bacterium]|nr:3-deoxy-7-phosphoheptulonate synthase [bacterium]